MPNQSQQRVYVNFTSDEFDNIASDLFQVTGFDGVEAISELFRFEIDLLSTDADIDLESLVGKHASLAITKDGEQRDFHGVIASLEQDAEAQFDHYCYKAVLVPRLWLMSLSKQNQIYQEKTVPEIVQQEILHGDFCGGILADDIDDRMAQTYPVREYTVQYRESDIDFISRLMENEGIYYYFEHLDGQDKLVFCDQNSKLDKVLDENIVSYVPKSGLASFDQQAIHRFKVKQAQVCKEIVLKDYNYREPHLPMVGTAETGDLGYGRQYAYGDHFKSTIEGNNLAHLRAQLELCKQRTCVGTSDALFFQAGKLIKVEDHYRASLNKEYLITRIRHMGGQALPGVSALGAGEAVDYQNEFDAIPSEIEFRPSLVTPKPKLYGFMSAIVDGALTSDRAQIDEHGRYKLIMPFDVSGSGDGKASRWVRKAEPFGGQGTGMSFPLLKGAEVIWSCMDGDLDRPIITGVVPGTGQGANKSVVTAQNSTDNVIKTPSGIVVQMRDGKGAPAPEDQEGTEQSQTRIPDEAPTSPFASSHYMASKDNTVPLIQQQQHTGAGETAGTAIDLGAVNSTYTHDCLTDFPAATDFLLEPGTKPSGMALTPAGALTWPTNVNGSHSFTITYTNADAESLQKGFYKIKGVLYFTSTAPDTELETGDSFSYTAVTTLSSGISYTLLASPTEMIIDADTGAIAWKTGEPGNFPITIRATKDDDGTLVDQTFTISVSPVDYDLREDNPSTPDEDETQKTYSMHLPYYRRSINKSYGEYETLGKKDNGEGEKQNSYSRIGSFNPEEMSYFDNVYYRAGTVDLLTGLQANGALSETFTEASDGGHKIMDVLNATRKTYDIKNSAVSGSGLFEGHDPRRFGLMEYTDGAKLMIHQNGCFDLAAGTSVTYDSLGTSDSLISVVLGEDGVGAEKARMIKSERFHYNESGIDASEWITETWENSVAYNYTFGQQHNIFNGATWDYKAAYGFEATIGGAVECTFASKTAFCLGINAELKYAADINYGTTFEYNCLADDSIDLCAGDNQMKGNTVLLQYEEGLVTAVSAKGPAVAAAVSAAALTGLVATGSALAKGNEGNVEDAATVLFAGANAVNAAAALVNLAGLRDFTKNKVKSKATTVAPPMFATNPYIKIDSGSITLHCGAASIVLNKSGEIKITGKTIKLTQESAPGVRVSELSMNKIDTYLARGPQLHSSTKLVLAQDGGRLEKGLNKFVFNTSGVDSIGTKIDQK